MSKKTTELLKTLVSLLLMVWCTLVCVGRKCLESIDKNLVWHHWTARYSRTALHSNSNTKECLNTNMKCQVTLLQSQETILCHFHCTFHHIVLFTVIIFRLLLLSQHVMFSVDKFIVLSLFNAFHSDFCQLATHNRNNLATHDRTHLATQSRITGRKWPGPARDKNRVRHHPAQNRARPDYLLKIKSCTIYYCHSFALNCTRDCAVPVDTILPHELRRESRDYPKILKYATLSSV